MPKKTNNKKREELDEQLIEAEIKAKKAEASKHIAEENKIKKESRNYWTRNIIGFLSLGSIIGFLLNYIILPTVEIKVREEKIRAQDKAFEVIEKQKDLDSAQQILGLKEGYIVRLEDSLRFEQERIGNIEAYNLELKEKLGEKNILFKRLTNFIAPPRTAIQKKNIAAIEKELQQVDSQVDSIEHKKELLKERSYASTCDSLMVTENIILRKNKKRKRYTILFPGTGYSFTHRIGVKITYRSGVLPSYILKFFSDYSGVIRFVGQYGYTTSVTREIDNFIDKNRNDAKEITYLIETQCGGRTYTLYYDSDIVN